MARKSPVNIEDFKSLGIAVIVRAIMDWECSMNIIKSNKYKPNSAKVINAEYMIREVESFFNSQWFSAFGNCDGPALFEKIKENYYEYGKCIPFKNIEDLR